MTITDCLGARQLGRFAHTLEATLDAPAKRSELVEAVPSTRLLNIADLLRTPVRSADPKSADPLSADTIDVHAATCDIAA